MLSQEVGSGDWPRSLGIVVPTLNAARFLPDTLRSLERLVAAGAQVIVVDGGSQDGTRAVCEAWETPMLEDHTPGLYQALNAGFRRLGTRWLTWINADDLLYPSGLLAYVPALETADVHYGTVDFIDADGRFLHAWQSAAPGRLKRLFEAGCSPLLQQGTIFRREVFDALGGFNAALRYVGDADFWWRALDAGFRFRRSPCPTVAGFRLHERQLSQVHAAAMKAEHEALVKTRRGGAGWCQLSPWVLSYRLANAGRYVVRALRRRDLAGRVTFPGSYDVP
jgi:glycosyltransferase involved in cell wall biosynthesis